MSETKPIKPYSQFYSLVSAIDGGAILYILLQFKLPWYATFLILFSGTFLLGSIHYYLDTMQESIRFLVDEVNLIQRNTRKVQKKEEI